MLLTGQAQVAGLNQAAAGKSFQHKVGRQESQPQALDGAMQDQTKVLQPRARQALDLPLIKTLAQQPIDTGLPRATVVQQMILQSIAVALNHAISL